MLKVKKKIQGPKNKSQDEDLTQLHNEIKNSIKNLYISDQKKKKTINEYAKLITKIKNKYAKLQKENSELKIELQKYQDYIQNKPQRSYQKPTRKRKHYYYNEPEESEESNSFVTEIRRRPKRQRKRIIYRDEIDGLPEYEPNSPTDEDQKEGAMRFKLNVKNQKDK